MRKYFIAIILLIGGQSCKVNNNVDYEMKVLTEIFDSLIEEMGVLSQFEIPPPPEMLIFDDNNNIIGYDTVGYKKENAEIENKNRKMRDTTFVIAVVDTLFPCHNEDLDMKYIKSQLPEQGYVEALNAMKNYSIVSLPLNLSKIGKRERLTLKYYSEFPKGVKIWEIENYDFLFSGVLEISRIYFDTTNQFGLLYSSYTCGRLCGEGLIICICKINGKWIIEKKISLWVS
ncbi:hypothetical protein [Bacteroides sp. UBA939]|uniref:hypothetical protein n=1 Tax=Bacteroides sp. UBA939 TaxID=1946092 RepID=UPI0025BAB20E|nr:hypothetical protein [Bacteroides sp. UBA939]